MAKRESATLQTGRSVLPTRSISYWFWHKRWGRYTNYERWWFACGRIRWWLRRWRCEGGNCGVWWRNEVVHAMTSYSYDGPLNTYKDPNRNLHLCPACKEQYVEHWSAMWDEYYGGLL